MPKRRKGTDKFMPLILPDQLPAIDELKQENIFTMGYKRADSQQIRPLRLAVLNLMPLKITTETDFIRILSNSALQIQVEFMKLKSHTSKNTPVEHMLAFYRNFEEMQKEKYDGLLVTGAPLEFIDYEDVTYWQELQEVFIVSVEAEYQIDKIQIVIPHIRRSPAFVNLHFFHDLIPFRQIYQILDTA